MLSPCNQKVYSVSAVRYPFLAGVIAPGDEYTTAFSSVEKKVLRKRRYEKPSDWVPKHRTITKGDFNGQCLSFEITPHLRGIMDAAVLSFIREVILCAAPQTAKTTGIDSIIAWTRIFDRGPACSFYPDKDTAERAMEERIDPLVKSSPVLKKQTVKGRDTFTAHRIKMVGGNWETGWVGSTAQTADRPLKVVDMQEVNKPAYGRSSEETSAVGLLRKRVRSYRGHKIFMSSTPTTETGNITILLENECEAVFVQWVRCPHCHEEIYMYFSLDTFKWPKEVDEESGAEYDIDRKIIKSKHLGRYMCQNCGVLWDDNDRNKAIRRETWRLRILDKDGEVDPDQKGEEMFRYLLRERPATIGFIMPSWMSYMVSLSEVVHDYLRCEDAKLDPAERLKAEKDFENSHKAGPWRLKKKARKSDELLRLKDSRDEGLVPSEGVAALVAGIDTQDYDFWYWVHAVGYGRNPKRWLIRCGKLDYFEDIRQVVLLNPHLDIHGNDYPVQQTLQDYQGHRASKVFDFCVTTGGIILPARGEQRMAVPYDTTPVEFYPGSDKRRFPGALRRVRGNATFYKDKADGILQTNRDDPGGIAFHSTIPDSHIEQLCEEARNEDGFWEHISSRPNHLWDCFYNALIAEDILGVRWWPEPGEDDEEEDDCVVSSVAATMG